MKITTLEVLTEKLSTVSSLVTQSSKILMRTADLIRVTDLLQTTLARWSLWSEETTAEFLTKSELLLTRLFIASVTTVTLVTNAKLATLVSTAILWYTVPVVKNVTVTRFAPNHLGLHPQQAMSK